MNKNHFEFLYIIGRGGFGKVWKVRLKKTNEFFALKEMSKFKIVDKHSEISIMSERNLLSTLNHSFIVNMYFAFQDFYNLYLVMDLLTGGDLRYHIAHRRTFSESETKFFISNMILALEYIHSKNIIHRDIKPENLVLESNGYLRITDFGVAKINEEDNSSETSGTPGYMAPEVILVLNHSFPSDFFALGVIGYEFMLGYRPYLGRSRKEIKELIINKQAKLREEDLPEEWSLNSMDFINKLLRRKVDKRLGFKGIDELKKHPWMEEIDWEKLTMKKITPPYIPSNRENYDKNYCEEEDEIGEETIERYQIYAQSELFPDVFKNYTFCNLSYISNYHIKRLKRFKENNIKIKDIAEQNVNRVLKEENEFYKLKSLEQKIKNNEIQNEIVKDNNNDNYDNKKDNNNFSKIKSHSKSVEDLNQYNIDNFSKKKYVKDESNKKENKNSVDKVNNRLNNNNSNSNYYTIETNKTNSNKKKNNNKSNNNKIKLSKYKKTKEYINNFKENIVYNNYINLHFNNFPNKNFSNINLESTLSKKKNNNNICKDHSNISNKTKSKINIIKNSNHKNKKNNISKSSSAKVFENNRNMINQYLSFNKDKYNHKNSNKKNIKTINQLKKQRPINNKKNKSKIKTNLKVIEKNPKKLNYNSIQNLLYNKNFDLLLDIINNNVTKNININNKKLSNIQKSRIGKSHSQYGFYTNEKILTTQRKSNKTKLSKKYRSLSMNNISNNINYEIRKNYKTLNIQNNKTKTNSKRGIRLNNKNKKYNIFSSSNGNSKSKKKRTEKNSKNKEYNSNKNSCELKKKKKIINFYGEYHIFNDIRKNMKKKQKNIII